MKKAHLDVVKSVIQKSKLSNKMVAEAFGYQTAETLQVEFLNTYGETLAEFRQRCKTGDDNSMPNNQKKTG